MTKQTEITKQTKKELKPSRSFPFVSFFSFVPSSLFFLIHS
ncbi:MAG TPA: hypothetical protein VNQ79_04025 [Blastocatellia bacterium]|nr:hypothetical protein [Blastocatellia bacterium]